MTLSEHWADGMQSLHGIHVHGFPNLFIVTLTQAANLISNIPHNYLEAGATIAAVVATRSPSTPSRGRGHARGRAGLGRAARGRRGARMTQLTGLHAGLLQQRGPADRGRRAVLNSMGFPEGPVAYFQYIDGWRSSGDFDGVEFR